MGRVGRAVQIASEEGIAELARQAYNLTNKVAQKNAAGAIVGLRGSPISYHGIRVHVDDPLIRRDIKGEFLLGLYEYNEIELLDAHFDGSSDVIELGAGIGVVSCYVDAIQVPGTANVVVEANPDAVAVLERNRGENGAEFEIESAAYAPGEETVELFKYRRFVGSGLHRETDESYQVETVSLAELADRHNLNSFTLISDIEGSEAAIFEDELDVVTGQCESMLIELHDMGDVTTEGLLDRIETAGFELTDRRENVYLFNNPAL